MRVCAGVSRRARRTAPQRNRRSRGVRAVPQCGVLARAAHALRGQRRGACAPRRRATPSCSMLRRSAMTGATTGRVVVRGVEVTSRAVAAGSAATPCWSGAAPLADMSRHVRGWRVRQLRGQRSRLNTAVAGYAVDGGSVCTPCLRWLLWPRGDVLLRRRGVDRAVQTRCCARPRRGATWDGAPAMPWRSPAEC